MGFRAEEIQLAKDSKHSPRFLHPKVILPSRTDTLTGYVCLRSLSAHPAHQCSDRQLVCSWLAVVCMPMQLAAVMAGSTEILKLQSASCCHCLRAVCNDKEQWTAVCNHLEMHRLVRGSACPFLPLSAHLFAGGPQVGHQAGAEHQAMAGLQGCAVQQRQQAALHRGLQPRRRGKWPQRMLLHQLRAPAPKPAGCCICLLSASLQQGLSMGLCRRHRSAQAALYGRQHSSRHSKGGTSACWPTRCAPVRAKIKNVTA